MSSWYLTRTFPEWQCLIFNFVTTWLASVTTVAFPCTLRCLIRASAWLNFLPSGAWVGRREETCVVRPSLPQSCAHDGYKLETFFFSWAYLFSTLLKTIWSRLGLDLHSLRPFSLIDSSEIWQCVCSRRWKKYAQNCHRLNSTCSRRRRAG